MSTPKRDQALETLRVIAIFGVVAFHSKVPFLEIPYAGLVIFVVLAPFVDTYYNWERPRPIGQLARTYVTPWVIWMVVYGGINIVIGRDVLPYGHDLPGILAGTIIHLWFLPAMFAVILALNGLKRIAQREVVFWGSLFGVVIAFATLVALAHTPLRFPFSQWLHAAPAVFIGAALGLAPSVRRGSLAALAVIGVCLVGVAFARLPGVSITYPLGVVAVVVTARWGKKVLPKNFDVQSVAACTFGIYLTHMIWVLGFGRILGRGSYLTATTAFVISLATVWLARRFVPVSKIAIG